VVYFSKRASVPLSDKTIITKQNQIENNGFRFRYWIHRCSHSISRRLFNHPMYAPFTKININSILYISILFYLIYFKFVVDLIADRTLLKITEEEFSGSPLSVSVFFFFLFG
jgi:hypothetical protein